MKRWLFLAFVLATGAGCGHLEDMMFGPDPYVAQDQSWGNPSVCSQSARLRPSCRPKNRRGDANRHGVTPRSAFPHLPPSSPDS